MTQRMNREQWLDKSLEIIYRQGFGQLNIDRLVRVMGVTKGSFYWHFSSRKDFIVQLIEHWDEKFTDIVIDHIDHFAGDPSECLHELMVFVTKRQLARYDFAIQVLTQSEPEAFILVEQILKKRVGYIASFFKKMGFQGRDLRFRSQALVMFMTQQQNNLLKMPKSAQLKNIELAYALFTKP